MRIERAVIDTNVLISAALSPRSVPAQLVDYLLQHGKAEWLISGDGDLLELSTTEWRFEILSPAQALAKWHRDQAR